MIDQDKLNKAVRLLLKMPAPPEHKRRVPTAEELRQKFVLRTDDKGNPVMKEVE